LSYQNTDSESSNESLFAGKKIGFNEWKLNSVEFGTWKSSCFCLAAEQFASIRKESYKTALVRFKKDLKSRNARIVMT